MRLPGIALCLWAGVYALFILWTVLAGVAMLGVALAKGTPLEERVLRANLAAMALGVGALGIVLLESVAP